MKTSITKLFPEFPFAHRQPAHDGHCALLHGHNWSLELTFVCAELEAGTGFVVDFGKLKKLRKWLEDHFDHTLVLNASDPFLGYLQEQLTEVRFDPTSPSSIELAKIISVPDCSCEGLARWLLDTVNAVFFHKLGVHADQDCVRRSVRISKVTVYEDSKNSATAEY